MITYRFPLAATICTGLLLLAAGPAPATDAPHRPHSPAARDVALRLLFPGAAACAAPQASAGWNNSTVVPKDSLALPKERHLRNIRQLTFGGENAEAYLSFDEQRLTMQARHEGMECDQIFTMNIDGSGLHRVSSGKGRTTCSYWLPGDERIIFSSTSAHGDGCLEEPDRSHGYVWKLYPEFDIYVMNSDGSGARPLHATPGYDAEATVSPKGDRIVFTSTESGDPEIYTMDLEGKDVRRLTHEKGYDGGAFFSPDGSRIVFRASRPKSPAELAAYDELVRDHLVRPGRLEICIMNADGSGLRQITSNNSANFAPFFHPDGKRVIFCSNMDANDPRNFDLYIINIDGTGLERITWFNEFDGFPMFTRDGKHLVFCSNRNNAKKGDTNVFIAEWID